MKIVIIDGNDIYGKEELYDIFQVKLGLDDFYGWNFDVLWDVIIGFILILLII